MTQDVRYWPSQEITNSSSAGAGQERKREGLLNKKETGRNGKDLNMWIWVYTAAVQQCSMFAWMAKVDRKKGKEGDEVVVLILGR